MTSTNDRTSKRRVAAVVALLLLLAGVGVWWLLQDDTEPQPSPATPAAPRTNPQADSDAQQAARRQAPVAHALQSESGVPETEPIARVGIEERQPTETAEELPPLYTIDGELVPPALRPRPETWDGEPVPFRVSVSGRVTRTDGKPVVGAAVLAKGEYQSGGNIVTRGPKSLYRYNRSNASAVIETGAAVSGHDGSYSMTVTGVIKRVKSGGTAWLNLAVGATAAGLQEASATAMTVIDGAEVPAEVTGLDIVLDAISAVKGTVVWMKDGTPAAGASVALTRKHDFSLVGMSPVHGLANVLTSRVLPGAPLAVIVGDDGNFQFEGVADGVYQCWAVWPGTTHAEWRFRYGDLPEASPQLVEVTLEGGAATEPLVLRLGNPGRLIFRTMPAVSGFRGLELRDETRARGLRPQSAVELTNLPYAQREDLAWVVEGLMPFHVLLRLRANGYQPVSVTLPPHSDGDTDIGVIELPAGAVIEGRVMDGRGVPLEGASVRLSDDGGGTTVARTSPSAYAETTSGPDGQFLLSGLWPEKHTLVAELDGFHPGTQVAVAWLKEGSGSPVEIRLSVADAMIRGRIELEQVTETGDSVTVGPPPHDVPKFAASVIAVDRDSGAGSRIRVGGDYSSLYGEFHRAFLPISPDWTFSGRVKAGRYMLLYSVNQERQVVEVEVGPGAEGEAVFRFGRRAGIRGTVAGLRGEALGNAKVAVYAVDGGRVHIGPGSRVAATAVTFPDGRFEVNGLVPGVYYVWLPDYPQAQRNPDNGTRNPARVALAAGQTGETVIDLSGRPAGASVYLTVTLNGQAGWANHMFIEVNQNPRETEHPGFFQLPDGRWLANGVPTGRHAVGYSLMNLAGRSNVGERLVFDVPHGEGEVHLSHDTQTVSFSGTVSIPRDGAELASEIRLRPVRLTGRGGEPLGTSNSNIQVSADGTFAGIGLVAGWYRFELSLPGRLPALHEAEVREGAVLHFTFGPEAGRIRLVYEGVLGLAEGDDLSSFLAQGDWVDVSVYDASDTQVRLQGRPAALLQDLIRNGSMVLEPVPNGRVFVRIAHPMAAPLDAPVDVLAGQETEARISFQLGPRLSVTVPASDLPVSIPPQFYLRLYLPGQTKSAGMISLKPQPDGSYSGHTYVSSAGTYELRPTGGRATPETASVTLAPGASVSHTIRMVPK